MCGIAGIISVNNSFINKERLELMSRAMTHRGPDGEGSWINTDNTAGFSHRRLSIIDLSKGGHQPMHLDNRYTIVYNGEIYNYIELREELTHKGYTFQSASDTEVVLAAYAHFGEKCMEHFDGMFAFAIWDEQEKSLFAARDRFGEKPLYFYYSEEEETFFFASEIKALLAVGAPDTRNDNMLVQFLASGLTSNKGDDFETFYKDIKRLPSRYCFRYTLPTKRFTVKHYYDVYKNEQVQDGDNDVLIKTFQDIFISSVQKRLRSDVSIGTSLSGGLDSSAILAAINTIQSPNSYKSFTASFEGSPLNEAVHAQKAAAHFGTNHYLLNLQQQDFSRDMSRFFAAHDEPVMSSSVYAQYKVYEFAKQHDVKVLLDGQGADEIFAGYHKYIHWYLQELYITKQHKLLKKELSYLKQHNIPFQWSMRNKVAARFAGLTAVQLEKRLAKQQSQSPILMKEYVKEHFSKKELYKPTVKKLNDILYFDLFKSLEDLLRYADTNSMAHGIEVRLPFLWHELVEYAFMMPSSTKIRNGYTKYLVRANMDALLPKEITWRKDKVGFEPPQQEWMKDKQFIEMTHEAKQKLVNEKILKPEVLQHPIVPRGANDADNYDWRYLSTVNTLFKTN